jgi:hypothetical protein
MKTILLFLTLAATPSFAATAKEVLEYLKSKNVLQETGRLEGRTIWNKPCAVEFSPLEGGEGLSLYMAIENEPKYDGNIYDGIMDINTKKQVVSSYYRIQNDDLGGRSTYGLEIKLDGNKVKSISMSYRTIISYSKDTCKF